MPLKYFKKVAYFSIILFTLSSLVNIASANAAVVNKITKDECIAWGIYCTGEVGGVNDEALGIANYFWAGIQVVLSFLAIIAAAALVYYGILYIISRGEEENARKAKTGIVSALIGMLVVGLAAWIVNAVINIAP